MTTKTIDCTTAKTMDRLDNPLAGEWGKAMLSVLMPWLLYVNPAYLWTMRMEGPHTNINRMV